MKEQQKLKEKLGACVAIINGGTAPDGRKNVGNVCGRVAKGEVDGKLYCGLHLRGKAGAKAEAKTCVAQIVANTKRQNKKQGDMCGKNAKHECKGKWYCGFHIHMADSTMAEAMAEMKIGEGEDEGEDEGQ